MAPIQKVSVSISQYVYLEPKFLLLQVIVVGAGPAGLAAAIHLKKITLEEDKQAFQQRVRNPFRTKYAWRSGRDPL
jgi:ribulose 1,5-bisphosphate synthetase/thiazole synthase